MIIDARRDRPSQALDCDVCIVGGGPAGLALAQELDDGRRSIVLLEGGGLRAERGAQALLASRDDTGAYPPLQSTRLAALGGSTQVWAGWCRPLDPVDFTEWPFGREALDPYYAKAHDFLGLGEFDYALGAGALSPAPLAPAPFAPVLFRQTLTSLARRCEPELRASSGIRALLHANALELIFSVDGRRVEGVSVASATARVFDVRARRVVLAAGGIENARLLLLSADPHPLVGRYFTEHVFVEAGTFVPARPETAAALVPRRGTRGATRLGWSLTDEALRRERLLNGAIYVHPGHAADALFVEPRVQALLNAWDMLRGRAVPYRLASTMLRGLSSPALAMRALWHRLSGPQGEPHFRLRGLFECSSHPDQRIELSAHRDVLGRRRTKVHWRFPDADLESVVRTHVLLDQALRRDGAGHLDLPSPEDADAWRRCTQPALHHLGTTRMHVDPRQGVVDADCRVHGIDNLYVAGGSVFPTGGYANPTLTLVALALRLAGHLGSQAQPIL